MSDGGLAPALLDLIARQLASMHHVEVLLLLRRTAPEPWDPARAAAELRGALAQTAAALEELARGGLLAAQGEAYRYAPATPALAAAADELAAMYNQRPVTLVRAIYERPAAPPRLATSAPAAPDPVRSFADAFRLRGGDA